MAARFSLLASHSNPRSQERQTVSNDLCTVEVQENEVKVPPIADSKEPGLSDHLRPQQKCLPTNDEQQEQQAPEQKSKKRSSTRLRTKLAAKKIGENLATH
eukprot:scaffold13597_cov91-Skeletonema_menzelii.AAC.1